MVLFIMQTLKFILYVNDVDQCNGSKITENAISQEIKHEFNNNFKLNAIKVVMLHFWNYKISFI